MAQILLGVSGGIAAYKACEIVRALVKRGDEVRVVMTDSAREFVQPLTLQVLSENPVGVTTFDTTYEQEIGHIDLARWADAVLLAPATANLIGKLAHGLADDLLTTVLLATTAPVVVAPAMNTQMWFHPAVQANIETLRGRHLVVDPDQGELACKEVGPGRLPDAEVLLQVLDRALAKPLLKGRRVLLTAGPTREYLDPARFLSNPSTGKMGQALAQAAWAMGADVTLVRGPVDGPPPYGARVIEVTTARNMHRVVMEEAAEMDFVAMVAAVADWRPAEESEQKTKKSEMGGAIELTRNPDILAELGARFGVDGDEEGPTLIGFAAQTHDVLDEAKEKRRRKGAHMIVANRIGGPSSTFGADRAEVHLITDDKTQSLPPAEKLAVAFEIWRAACALRSR